MAEKILSRVIVEIVGKPKEHVEEAINMVVDKTEEIKGLKIERKHIAPIKSLKNEILNKTEEKIQKQAGELFSTFAELDLRSEHIDPIASFCFEFMPSSIEIMEPEKTEINLMEFSKLMNDVLSKIHNADMAVKKLNFENSALKTNATLLLRNMIIVSLKSKAKTIEELSKSTGIPSEQLKPFLESLIIENFIKKEDEIYKV
jgi:hypothetical protein